MRFSPPVLLSAAVLPAALAAAAGIRLPAGPGVPVRDVQITRGDSIIFVNEDDFVHQIYVNSPSFTYESEEQEPGKAMDVRFPAAGTFEVRCHIHPKMLLTVNVR